MAQPFRFLDPARTPAERLLIRLTVVCALLVPALTGALVKLRLDSMDKPTLTWFDGAVGIVFISAAAGVGWMLLVLPLRFCWFRFGADPRRARGLAWAWASALVGASIALGVILYDLLQVAAIAAMVAVLAPWVYWRATLAGGLAAALAGYWVGTRIP